MLDVIILALALSMDAFAVSLGLGAKPSMNIRWLSIISGLYFGIFQGLMALAGHLGGAGILGKVELYAPWLAFVLLTAIGAKMIYESRLVDIEKPVVDVTQKVLLMLAVATSIDAMAAGYSLSLFTVSPFVSCAIIGFVTLILSSAGVVIGAKYGTWLEKKSELAGGIVLILIGLKIVMGSL